jgi:hypothetical protein
VNTQNYNFACGSVWVLNLVSDIKGGTHRLRVFENRVLRRIFGSKRDEVTGGWRKLHNEELHNFAKYNYENDQVKDDCMGRACSTKGWRRRMHIGYWWESQKERGLGRTRRRWVDNIKMDLGWGGMDWIDVA